MVLSDIADSCANVGDVYVKDANVRTSFGQSESVCSLGTYSCPFGGSVSLSVIEASLILDVFVQGWAVCLEREREKTRGK